MNSSRTPHRVGTLEIQQHLPGQELIWKMQRWGRALLILFLLAGGIGVFGGGWLGRANTHDPTGALKVSHARFARVQAPTDLRVEIAPGHVAGGEVALWIDVALLDGLAIDDIRPAPVAQQAGPGRVEYRFRVNDADLAVPVVLHASAQGVGFHRGALGIVGGPEIAMEFFVFP